MRTHISPWMIAILLVLASFGGLFLWWQQPLQKLYPLFAGVRMGAKDFKKKHGAWPKAEGDVAAFVHSHGDLVSKYFTEFRYEFSEKADGRLLIHFHGEVFDGEKYDFEDEMKP